jgi:hypothetical protein
VSGRIAGKGGEQDELGVRMRRRVGEDRHMGFDGLGKKGKCEGNAEDDSTFFI